MIRRKRNIKPLQLNLFPFLSVLACTIGVLILLVIVLTTQLLGENKQITILLKTDSNETQAKVPTYIECRAGGVVLYPSQEFVSEDDLTNSYSPFQKLLEKLAEQRDTSYLIVAIKPSGMEVFEEVRDLVEAANIDLGFEPIAENWQLQVKDQVNIQ
jgi:biopolymer transport protein ExbD